MADKVTVFEELLSAGPERLLNLFYPLAGAAEFDAEIRRTRAAKRLALHPEQLICAAGFNPALRPLADVLHVIGYESFERLARQRNEVFVTDIYHHVTIDNVLAIYQAVRGISEMVDVLQYLLVQRLGNIEKRIEATVNSLVIERYKKEMRAIYNSGIARIDFAEARLNQTESGFRALVNEVSIITESKLIPVGDIFFRSTILPEEKRKLITKGLIPRALVRARLEDPGISAQERRMLEDYVDRASG
jgi:hypothetical protein